MRQILTDVIPKLSLRKHKGQDGRLCIVGGSLEYTGAPFYCGFAALRSGADLVHVVCDKQAAIPIKSLSPELMVGPYLDCTSKGNTPELDGWIKGSLRRMHSIVLGPGLGRNDMTMHQVSTIIENAKRLKVPMVMDGDALWLLAQEQYRGILKDIEHRNVILTPNAMEFRRLWMNHIEVSDQGGDQYLPPFDTTDLLDKMMQKSQGTDNVQNEEQKDDKGAIYQSLKCGEILLCSDFEAVPEIKDTALLASRLGGVTILRKGAIDILSNGHEFVLISEPCSLRRCGGQGDILCGVIGLWLHWALMAKQEKATLIAGFAGAYLMREYAASAFKEFKRSTLTTDMIEIIPRVMDAQFPLNSSL